MIVGRKTFAGASARDDTRLFEWQWDDTLGALSHNKGGYSGWARVLKSNSKLLPVGELHRIHLCAEKPCTAWHPSHTYTAVPFPIHVWGKAVPEPVEPPAVAAPSQAPQAVPAEPATVAEPGGTVEQVPVGKLEVEEEKVQAPLGTTEQVPVVTLEVQVIDQLQAPAVPN